MANPFVHVELNTADLKAAKQFYRKLFGWKLSDMKMPGMTYTMIEVGEGTGGGMQVKPMPEAPNHWLTYVLVDSVKKTIAKAAKNGAQIYVDYMPIPGMGALGIFADPQGAVLGIWEAEMKQPPARKQASGKKAAPKKASPKKAAAKR